MMRLTSDPDLICEEEFGLYIGTASHAANIASLRGKNIGLVLNVSDRVRYKRIDDGPAIPFHFVPMSDYGDSDLAEVLPECFDILDEAKQQKKNILVHCQGGVNRSATVVIAFLMYSKQWSLRKSFDFVRERRKIVSPHEKYMRQLVRYEHQLFNGVTTIDIAEYCKTSVQAQLRNISNTYNASGNTADHAVSGNSNKPNLIGTDTISLIESKSTLSSIYAFDRDAKNEKTFSCQV